MNQEKKTTTLSIRLKKIADQVPKGMIVADIGTDHAYLPTYLVTHHICPRVIAGEYHEGPFLSAQRQVKSEGLAEQIEVRRGDGLSVLEPGEAEVITISGMGGGLIAQILERDPSVLEGVKRLILQPNVGEDLLRLWLKDHHWRLMEESILEEDGKIYEVLTANRGISEDLYDHPFLTVDWLLRLGPYLVRKKNRLLILKWKREYEKLTKVIQQISLSDTEEARQKKEEITAYFKQLEGIIEWLQMETPSSKP
jgi:tRNA (adenine22-N1)-methyltransferase